MVTHDYKVGVLVRELLKINAPGASGLSLGVSEGVRQYMLGSCNGCPKISLQVLLMAIIFLAFNERICVDQAPSLF